MTEILNIFFLIVISIIIFNSKLPFFFNSKYLKMNNFSFIENFNLNIIIVSTFFLLMSFLSLNYFFLLSLIIFLNILFYFKSFLEKKIINKFLLQSILIYFVSCMILSTDLITNLKLEWDGHLWYFHALNFNEKFNFFNLSKTNLSHYPHLGGVLWNLFWEISFFKYEFYGRIIYVIIYVASILLVAEMISKRFLILFLSTLVLIIFTHDKFLFGGYQEYLIFSFLIIIYNLLNKLDLKNLNYFQIVLLLTSTNLLLWSKNEGLFYFLIVIFYLLFFQNTKKKIIIILISSMLIFLKLHLMSFNSASNVFYDVNFNLSFYDFITKLIFILKHIIIAMFKYPIWIIFLFLLIAKKFQKNDIAVIYFASSSILLIITIFIFSNVEAFEWHVTGALDRLIFSTSGFLMIFVASRFNFYLSRYKN